MASSAINVESQAQLSAEPTAGYLWNNTAPNAISNFAAENAPRNISLEDNAVIGTGPSSTDNSNGNDHIGIDLGATASEGSTPVARSTDQSFEDWLSNDEAQPYQETRSAPLFPTPKTIPSLAESLSSDVDMASPTKSRQRRVVDPSPDRLTRSMSKAQELAKTPTRMITRALARTPGRGSPLKNALGSATSYASPPSARKLKQPIKTSSVAASIKKKKSPRRVVIKKTSKPVDRKERAAPSPRAKKTTSGKRSGQGNLLRKALVKSFKGKDPLPAASTAASSAKALKARYAMAYPPRDPIPLPLKLNVHEDPKVTLEQLAEAGLWMRTLQTPRTIQVIPYPVTPKEQALRDLDSYNLDVQLWRRGLESIQRYRQWQLNELRKEKAAATTFEPQLSLDDLIDVDSLAMDETEEANYFAPPPAPGPLPANELISHVMNPDMVAVYYLLDQCRVWKETRKHREEFCRPIEEAHKNGTLLQRLDDILPRL
ncbi:hypothetical protein BDN72DRAFT_342049 [Pluteus cervinus]|uniref:Uncharacterized protein n=1 Tax=Pluteus cervinus TaxID=181527 RepID=A0ACD3ADQ8_9AGAR|nr:hypothetical protein BDN72DRAFT_342049 [Pluteus cervinus]